MTKFDKLHSKKSKKIHAFAKEHKTSYLGRPFPPIISNFQDFKNNWPNRVLQFRVASLRFRFGIWLFYFYIDGLSYFAVISCTSNTEFLDANHWTDRDLLYSIASPWSCKITILREYHHPPKRNAPSKRYPLPNKNTYIIISKLKF